MDAPFTIAIDTREQLPWRFKRIRSDAKTGRKTIDVPTQRATLNAGDYSIIGMEDEIAIERKSLADLFGSVGKGHARFRREHERLATRRFAAVIVEANFEDLWENRPEHTRVKSKTPFRCAAKWSVEFGVHWVWASRRALAEQYCYRILHNYWFLHGSTDEPTT